MNTKKKSPIGEDQIKRWKNKFVSVSVIETTDEEDNKLYFYFRKPDMMILSLFIKKVETDPVQANVLLFQNCLLNKENQSYKDDVDVMSSIMPYLNILVDQRKASIKKL